MFINSCSKIYHNWFLDKAVARIDEKQSLERKREKRVSLKFSELILYILFYSQVRLQSQLMLMNVDWQMIERTKRGMKSILEIVMDYILATNKIRQTHIGKSLKFKYLVRIGT